MLLNHFNIGPIYFKLSPFCFSDVYAFIQMNLLEGLDCPLMLMVYYETDKQGAMGRNLTLVWSYKRRPAFRSLTKEVITPLSYWRFYQLFFCPV